MPKIVNHEARRRDFIEAACEILLEEGLSNTTVRSVAKRAGYTTGALVHYFRDKDELIRAALDANGERVRARMIAAHKNYTGREGLVHIVREALPISRVSRLSWKVWLALWYHSEKSEAMRREERKRYREWLGRVSEALQESVELRELPATISIEDEARSIVALIDGLGVQCLMSGNRMPARKIEALFRSYLDKLYST